MLPTIPTLSDSRLFTIAGILALVVVLVIALGTSVALIQQLPLAAIAGRSGYQAVLLGLLLVVVPVQGLVLPQVLVRDRPYGRLLWLTLLFLATMGSYLAGLLGWWQLFVEPAQWSGLQGESDPGRTLELAGVLQERSLPIVFAALLKDLLLSSFVGCLLCEVLRGMRLPRPSSWTGANR